MKKSIFPILFAFSLLFVVGCGPSAEEQAKQKEEILKVESATVELDSTLNEVKKSTEELDDLINQLKAE